MLKLLILRTRKTTLRNNERSKIRIQNQDLKYYLPCLDTLLGRVYRD